MISYDWVSNNIIFWRRGKLFSATGTWMKTSSRNKKIQLSIYMLSRVQPGYLAAHTSICITPSALALLCSRPVLKLCMMPKPSGVTGAAFASMFDERLSRILLGYIVVHTFISLGIQPHCKIELSFKISPRSICKFRCNKFSSTCWRKCYRKQAIQD